MDRSNTWTLLGAIGLLGLAACMPVVPVDESAAEGVGCGDILPEYVNHIPGCENYRLVTRLGSAKDERHGRYRPVDSFMPTIYVPCHYLYPQMVSRLPRCLTDRPSITPPGAPSRAPPGMSAYEAAASASTPNTNVSVSISPNGSDADAQAGNVTASASSTASGGSSSSSTPQTQTSISGDSVSATAGGLSVSIPY
jgi:hypothetical protein